MLGQKHAALALVQTIDDGELVTHGFLRRDHARQAGLELLEGAQHELECFGRSNYVLGYDCPCH